MLAPLAVSVLHLAVAAILFPLGVAVLSMLARPRRWGELITTSVNLLAWLLIALAAVLVLYAFFPDSKAEGTALNIKVGGGVAAFVLIWLLGTRQAGSSMKLDEVVAQRDAARDELQRLRTLSDGTPGAPIENELTTCGRHEYLLPARRGRTLALVTGNIRGAKGQAEVWVNSENTHMQMARFYDRSISGAIRYLGARKAPVTCAILEDTIAEELEHAVEGAPLPLQPATVIATGPGALAESHGVKRIFHVAAVHGEPGVGYRPVSAVGQCVTACLELADSAAERDHKLRSILFPILGAGTGRGGRDQAISAMVDAALDYFETNPKTQLRSVCLLAWTDDDLATCREVCGRSERLMDAETRVGTPVGAD
jgi:O-acetyl-ADP-ribose deacetylase (regulator of RNase III)